MRMKSAARAGVNGGPPPVIVLGDGITALGALRALARARLPSYVVAQEPRMLARSRWYRPLSWGPGGPPTPWSLADRLATGAPLERAVLLPGSDDWALAVADLPPLLRGRFPASLPERETLERFVDKGRFARLLREAEVPHPRTAEVTEPEDLRDLEWMMSEGGFLKPRDSSAFFRRFGVKAFAVAGRNELRSRFQRIHDAGLQVLLQEYIPGPARAHVFLDGFVDGRGRMTGILVRRRMRMYPEDFGNSTLTESIPLKEAAPAVEALQRLFEAVGYRGIFSAEFKQDPRDGVFKLLEVNPRAWWYVDFTARCGVDVCSRAYLDALGRPVPTVPGYRVGARCIHADYDVAAYRHARLSEGVGAWSWFRPWLGAHQTILAMSDPGPALHALGRRLRHRFSRPPSPTPGRQEQVRETP